MKPSFLLCNRSPFAASSSKSKPNEATELSLLAGVISSVCVSTYVEEAMLRVRRKAKVVFSGKANIVVKNGVQLSQQLARPSLALSMEKDGSRDW